MAAIPYRFLLRVYMVEYSIRVAPYWKQRYLCLGFFHMLARAKPEISYITKC